MSFIMKTIHLFIKKKKTTYAYFFFNLRFHMTLRAELRYSRLQLFAEDL